MVTGFGVGRLLLPPVAMVPPQTLEAPSELGTSGGVCAVPELLAEPIGPADA